MVTLYILKYSKFKVSTHFGIVLNFNNPEEKKKTNYFTLIEERNVYIHEGIKMYIKRYTDERTHMYI